MRLAALNLVFLLSLFLHFRVSQAQVYPVQLSTQLLPPYSSYLPDYGDPTNEKLKCILVLQDFSVTHRDVKLEITITGNGFSIHTSGAFVPAPITLTPGAPVLITGADLAPYLETQHLNFTGINAADYELRKILPEGYYSICVKAVDYYNPNYTVISNESCNNAWFFLNDPPFLNFPQCETEITPLTPQNIVFQWTAMNLNSPNSAFGTEYDFELFEVRPNTGIPNNIVQTTAPIFSITTTNAFFQYGITEPILYTGMQYAWRVRARDLSGRDLFKNDGWSQVCTFTYGDVVSSFGGNAFTLSLQAQASTHRQGKVWWNHIANFSQYHVQVRKAGTENWFDYYSQLPELKINELEPSTAYEARVMGTGSGVESDWSNIAGFSTPPLPQYSCNDQTQPINALSANPLLQATAGMIFQTGQFEMIATQITPDTGPPGYFSGYGKVIIYGLNIGVQYTHVYINDNLEITSGNLVALTEGIQSWEADWMLNQAMNDPTWIDGVIDSIYVGIDSTITIITDDGDTLHYNFPPEGPIVFNSEDGTQYTVYPDGTIVVGNWMDYSNDHLDCTAQNKVIFSAATDQRYGLDSYSQSQWTDDYEIIRLSDSTNYFTANKSLKTGGSDYVVASFASENLPITTLTFKTSGGQILTHEITGSQAKIHLQNINEGESVYAVANEQRLGKLNIHFYEEETRDLVVVPVGNAAVPNENELMQEINTTFYQGVMHFTLTIKPVYQNSSWDLNGDGLLAAGDYGLLQDYSNEMQELSSNWLDENETDKDAYVLFIIPGFDAQNVDKGGYMPLGRHKGFIKSGSNTKVFTHELGHGVFGLEHTFPEVSEGSTENLMDYSGGNDLSFHQWEQMRWRWSQFDLFNDEEESFYHMSFVDLNDSLIEDATPEPTNNCRLFLSKFGKIIQFTSATMQDFESYLLREGRLQGVIMNVAGVPKKFVQASEAHYSSDNGVKQVTSTEYNNSLICFECLDEICSQVTEFSGPEVCEIVQGVGLNGQPTKIYNRIPSAFVIDLRKYIIDCTPGQSVISGIDNGIIQCKTITTADCDAFNEDGTGTPLTGEEVVRINEVSEALYNCETNFAWMSSFNYPVIVSDFTAVASASGILGFKKNGKEYVICENGNTVEFIHPAFYNYVDKELFLELKNTLSQQGKEIRVKDITEAMIYKESLFVKAGNQQEVHYRKYDDRSCYFEYYFFHDGRNTYEFDGTEYTGFERNVYWRKGCGLEILHDAFCGTAIASAQSVADFLNYYIDIFRIPERFYNPEDPEYDGVFYRGYREEGSHDWSQDEISAMMDYAYFCGLVNGVADETQGLINAVPMLLMYVCDQEFRQDINAALAQIDMGMIESAIQDDFNGNAFQKAEAMGRYTVLVLSMVIPITQTNWSVKVASVVSKVKTFSGKTMSLIKKVKSNAIYGLEVVRSTTQKIIFENPSGQAVDLIRFTDDGVMVIDESRIISQLPENYELLFDLSETAYKTTDDGIPSNANLKVVRSSDGEVWVVAQTGNVSEILWKPGWNAERVLEYPKGSRPDPSLYLELNYIEEHLSEFEEGASYLVPKSSLDNHGRELIGRPDGQFIMTKSEMDKLLADSHGDISIIQNELGIPNNLWGNKQIVRIDIPDMNQLNLRMANGNEAGANELWIPGGKLPNGRLEAVINQIPQGNYIETLLVLE